MHALALKTLVLPARITAKWHVCRSARLIASLKPLHRFFAISRLAAILSAVMKLYMKLQMCLILVWFCLCRGAPHDFDAFLA